MARTPSSKPRASRQDTGKIAEPDHATRDAASGSAHVEPFGDHDGTHVPDTYAVTAGRLSTAASNAANPAIPKGGRSSPTTCERFCSRSSTRT
jgi:hypothetical protein